MALDDCRKCCGGHGYSLSSGIPEMWTAFTHMETAEGGEANVFVFGANKMLCILKPII